MTQIQLDSRYALFAAPAPRQLDKMYADYLNDEDAWDMHLPPRSSSYMAAELGQEAIDGTAAYTVVCAENATLETVAFKYETGKPMRAFIEGGSDTVDRLDINVAVAVSGHDGLDKATEWAKSNQYIVRVSYPDGTSEDVQFDTRGVKDSSKTYSTPKYGTVSPTISIDVQKYRGQDVTIESWPVGSAGVWGYVEGRRTILHL